MTGNVWKKWKWKGASYRNHGGTISVAQGCVFRWESVTSASQCCYKVAAKLCIGWTGGSVLQVSNDRQRGGKENEYGNVSVIDVFSVVLFQPLKHLRTEFSGSIMGTFVRTNPTIQEESRSYPKQQPVPLKRLLRNSLKWTNSTWRCLQFPLT